MLLCRKGVFSEPADRTSAGYLAHFSFTVEGTGGKQE